MARDAGEAGPERVGPGGGQVDRLAEVLAGLGRAGADPVELAELLWLAARSAPVSGRTVLPGKEAEPSVEALPERADAVRPEPGPGAALLALHLPAAEPSGGLPGGGTVAAPSAPMLARPLDVQRALRPLKRQVPDPRRTVLDESATADRLAEALRGPGPVQWLPVLRPGSERWLSLRLVLDTGPTMALWRPLARELRTLLRQTGAFRQVTRAWLAPDGTLTGHQPGPRTATLVLSDAMGPQWRPGRAGERWHRTLTVLARLGPVALLQPLPERLWPLTAVPATAGLLTAPEAGATNAAYGFAPLEPPEPSDCGAGGPRRPAGPVLPVLEADPAWLANWAQLVGSPGGVEVVGAAVRLGGAPTAPHRAGPEPGELTPAEAVRRFRATASREAYTLAGLAALTTPALPVLRLLQRAAIPRPRPQQLAELVVSGLLVERPGHPERFDFRPGVRELLVHTLPRSVTHQAVGLLVRVGEEVAARAGRVPDEIAAIAATDTEGAPLTAERRPFALVSPAALGIVGVEVPRQAARIDPARSWAVLYSEEVEEVGQLAAHLTDRDLVGLPRGQVWSGDDPAAFRAALRTAARSAEDTLLVLLAAPPGFDPGAELAARALVKSPARTLVLAERDTGVSAQVWFDRPPGARSLASLCNEVFRFGWPGGPPELTLGELLAEAAARADDGSELLGSQQELVFLRNPATGRRHFYLARDVEPDPRADRFFEDLCEEVWQLSDLAGVAGQPDAVRHCEVFVPLYGHGCFRNPRASREWSAFGAHRSAVTATVPVFWDPLDHRQLPTLARRFEYRDRALGARYADQGLRALDRPSYELVVRRIAERIVTVADRPRPPLR
ncbi:SAV_2336 N-terminal domain-related protein [Kitasatospora sp. NPDC096147]|uniref:SAV_2336 N-terminal domain-related protein n=1 Tax=Kitasatospora sp. NPDC096147 TaxID=3364093 RepID=UPI0037FA2060